MANEKGQRIGGRQKGTPNKKTLILKDLLDKMSFDPAKKLVEMMPDLNYELKAKICLELMEYLYPKRKAIEHSGPDGEAIEINQHQDIDQEQVNQLKAELKKLVSK